jgi:uncharacterized membrane protein YccC
VRRLFWATVGIGIGAVVGVAAVRWVGRTKQRLSPPNLARQAGSRAASVADRLRAAIDEGRVAMMEREAELRVELGLPES